jgi:CRP/FNR family transcriptional regulator
MPGSLQCSACSGAAGSLFSCLLPEQRSRLSSAAVSHAYRAHETLFHEGTPALAIHCVRSGAIKLFRRLENGEEVVVGIRGPGDLIGLRGVLAGIPYANTATTLDPAFVCAIPGETFVELVRENPILGLRILTRLARESRRAEEQLVERTHSRVAKRTARFLAQHFHAGALPAAAVARAGISMSREEMAQLIGTTPETLSRTLHGLADDGILALDRRMIRVLDLPALLKRAE